MGSYIQMVDFKLTFIIPPLPVKFPIKIHLYTDQISSVYFLFWSLGNKMTFVLSFRTSVSLVATNGPRKLLLDVRLGNCWELPQRRLTKPGNTRCFSNEVFIRLVIYV